MADCCVSNRPALTPSFVRIDEFAPSAAISSRAVMSVSPARSFTASALASTDSMLPVTIVTSLCRFSAAHSTATDGLTSTIQPSSAAVDFGREEFDVSRAALLARVDRRERTRRERAPHVEFGEQCDRSGIHRHGAHVEAELPARHRRFAAIDEHHLQAAARQCERRAGADQAAARDENVTRQVAHCGAGLIGLRITASISLIVFGAAAVSTSWPSRVTSTSSSMRMPMPRYFAGTESSSGM